ncbi:hypothetical protein HGRIS_014449 [Hohenbuehelia grisea]|uniref:WSC domain-containing protein n=1 Tax=Hohenbuehelia grisea TaxID=104357 RepID=A0ABR3JTF8_9AGAR
MHLLLTLAFATFTSASPSPLAGLQLAKRATLPTGWEAVGCYTDNTEARTLSDSSKVISLMTVEACIQFCASGGYPYAGVEYGNQCFCDFSPQNPGALAAAKDCNIPCPGDKTETCGGKNRLNVFYDTDVPNPTLVTTVSNTFTYQGCYTDQAAPSRTLERLIAVPGGTTPETCAATCRSNGYTYAGMEFQYECWCGNSVRSTATKVPDSDCQDACNANIKHYCGGRYRLQLYHDTSTCTTTSYTGSFTLQGTYKSASNAATALGIGNIASGVLSGRSILVTGRGDYGRFTFANGILTGTQYLGLVPGIINARSSSLATGDSPVFTTSNSGTYSGYCTSPGPGGTILLGAQKRADAWYLCPDTTAAGKLEVVFDPQSGNPRYSRTSCQAITISLQRS